MRSLLKVKSGDLDRLGVLAQSGADALILPMRSDHDGETSAAVIDAVHAFLLAIAEDEQRPLLYVHVPDLDDAALDQDLATLVEAGPDGFLLAPAASGEDVQRLGAKLAVHEAVSGREDGEMGIIAEAGSSALSLLRMESFVRAGRRLLGLAWNAGALAADLDIAPEPDEAGPLDLARTLTLVTARAAGVGAIDSVSDQADEAAFRSACEKARHRGFNAKIAATPEQVAIINAVFDRDL